MEEPIQQNAEPEFHLRLLGCAIEEIYKIGTERTPGQISFEELKKKALVNENSVEYLRGALGILHILGLITFTNDDLIRVPSRQARFTLGSLAKYCNGAVQVVNEPLDEDYESKYLVELTRAFESTRSYKKGIDKNL